MNIGDKTAEAWRFQLINSEGKKIMEVYLRLPHTIDF
jgi:hypothetical protein